MKFFMWALMLWVMPARCQLGGSQNLDRVLIFADVTGSIKKGEFDEICNLTIKTMNSTRLNTMVILYPINSEMELPQPIVQITMERALTRDQEQDIRRRLQRAYDSEVVRRQPEPRTCILRAMGFAASQSREQRQASPSPVRIIVISDMIEECQERGPLGGGLDFMADKSSLQTATERLKKNLVNVEYRFDQSPVVVIVPPRMPPKGQRPDPLILEAFWRAYFAAAAVPGPRYRWLSGRTAEILDLPKFNIQNHSFVWPR